VRNSAEPVVADASVPVERYSSRGGAYSPIVELTLSRVREIVREPELLFWSFVFPILMAVALAVAFPSRTAPAIVGIEPGAGYDAARAILQAQPGIKLRDVPAGGESRALREGEVHLLLVPATPPTYRFDPTRAEGRAARLLVDDALKRAAGRSDPWVAREAPVQVAGSRYVDWLIPGIVGMNVMGTSMWGIAFSIVTARMRKLLKRLIASPMRRRDYLLAQLLARVLFLAPEVIVPLAFGALVLGMPIHGSWMSIAVVSVIGALAFGAIGLLAATRIRTIEGISGLMNVIMLPMWILSGVFFSSSNFPDAVQPFVHALPLTALVDALRAVVLDGAGVSAVRGELTQLTAWAVVPFGLAVSLFRWR
jgi:ABC-2 type transport system permease protein